MNAATIAEWLAEWSALWNADLAGRVQVEPGRRLRTSLGRCHSTTGRIQIHPALFEPANAELFREVVCHEAAHAAVRLLYGRNVRPHGPEWKALVADAGYPPTARMDPRRLSGELQDRLRPRVRYRHLCPICGVMRMAGRRVGTWRCGRCHDRGLGGRLRIERVALARET